MATITFTESNGTTHVINAAQGQSLMQVAVDNFVPGIFGDCGGYCSCATCHAYVDASWQSRLPPVNDDEAAMLDGAIGTKSNSRLCCQLKASDEIDGLVLYLLPNDR